MNDIKCSAVSWCLKILGAYVHFGILTVQIHKKNQKGHEDGQPEVTVGNESGVETWEWMERVRVASL